MTDEEQRERAAFLQQLGAVHGSQLIVQLSAFNDCECVACALETTYWSIVWHCHGEELEIVLPSLEKLNRKLAEFLSSIKGAPPPPVPPSDLRHLDS